MAHPYGALALIHSFTLATASTVFNVPLEDRLPQGVSDMIEPRQFLSFEASDNPTRCLGWRRSRLSIASNHTSGLDISNQTRGH